MSTERFAVGDGYVSKTRRRAAPLHVWPIRHRSAQSGADHRRAGHDSGGLAGRKVSGRVAEHLQLSCVLPADLVDRADVFAQHRKAPPPERSLSAFSERLQRPRTPVLQVSSLPADGARAARPRQDQHPLSQVRRAVCQKIVGRRQFLRRCGQKCARMREKSLDFICAACYNNPAREAAPFGVVSKWL